MVDVLGEALSEADGVEPPPAVSLLLSFALPFIMATPMPMTTAATTAMAPISRPLVFGPRPRPPPPPDGCRPVGAPPGTVSGAE